MVVEGSREDLLKAAPVLPATDSVVMFWDVKSVPQQHAGMDVSHRFLGSRYNDDTELSVENSGLLLRHTVLQAKFEPVEWECRAPLRGGALCTRQDRVRCPFHGPIIPRDRTGTPNGPETNAAVATSTADVHTNIDTRVTNVPRKRQRDDTAVKRTPSAKETESVYVSILIICRIQLYPLLFILLC